MTQALVVNKKSKAILTRVRSVATLSELTAPTRTIRRAVALWKASEYDDTQLLKDLMGNGLDARLGSGSGVDSADPKFLGYKPWGVNPDGSVNQNGVYGCHVATDDKASLRITGDIEVIWKGSFSTITRWDLVSKWNVSNLGYLMRLGTTGTTVEFIIGVGGSALTAVSSLHGVTANSEIWFKATRVQSTGLVSFFKSTDGVTWTAIGTAVLSAGSAISTTTQALSVGARTDTVSSNPLVGKTSRAIVKSGIDGTTVADFDASKIKSAGFYEDAQGNLWAGAGSAAWGDHLRLNNTTGNYAVKASASGPLIEDNWQVEWVANMGNTGTSQCIAGWRPGSGSTSRGWMIYLYLYGTPSMRVFVGDYSTALDSGNITVSGLITGVPQRYRLTHTLSTGAIKIERYENGEWVVVGNGAMPSPSPAFFPEGPFKVGIVPYSETANPLLGNVHRVIYRSDGIERADVRFDKPLKWNNGQHTDPQGNVWTINRSALQNRLKVVANSHVELFGNVGEIVATPDASELDVTGDIDVRVRARHVTWAPSQETLIAKYEVAGNQRSWRFSPDSNGRLYVQISDTGTSGTVVTSTAVAGIAANADKWIRFTRTQADGVVRFYTSDDGIAWTKIGADVVGLAGAALLNSSGPLLFGGYTGGGAGQEKWNGRIYEAQVWKGIPGVSASARLVANPKFTALTSYAPYKESSYLGLPGAGGAYASTPDDVSLDITGDIDVRWYGAPDKSVPGVFQALVSKEDGSNAGYLLTITSGGFLRFTWGSGATRFDKDSTVAHAIPDGATKWIRATLDVDNGATGSDLKFWLSDDGVAWTQLGATVTTAGVTSIATNAKNLWIGSRDVAGSNLPHTGKTLRAIIKNGIDGTTVFDADFTNLLDGQAAFTEVTGKTVTINGTARIERRTWSFTRASLSPRAELRTGRYAYLPGVAGNYFSLPDDPSLDITGDLDLRVKVALADYTPATNQQLMGRYGTGGSGRAYWLQINAPPGAAGTLQLNWNDGADKFAVSTVPVSVPDGTAKWFRATLDVDNGAGGWTATFYTSDDGIAWSQLGATVTTAGVTSIVGSTQPLVLGAVASGTIQPSTGTFYQAELRDGINGTIVAAFDMADHMLMPVEPHNNFTDLYGNVWTVNRATTKVYKTAIVDRPIFLLDGVDDNFVVTDNPLIDFAVGQNFTVLLILRQHAVANTARSDYFNKGGANFNSPGWWVYRNNNLVGIVAGGDAASRTDNYENTVLATGVTGSIGGVFDGTADLIRSVKNGVRSAGVADTTTGTHENAQNLAIGGIATEGIEMEFIGAAIFKEALTDQQIAEVLTSFEYDPELVGVL